MAVILETTLWAVVNIGAEASLLPSGADDSLLSDGSKLLYEPMLAFHHKVFAPLA